MKKTGIYAPAEDTFLLSDCVKMYNGKWALEIGIGSGAVTRILKENFENVAGSDIDFDALRQASSQVDFMPVCCDAAAPFNAKFDLVVTNPPYLPGDPESDSTVYGGKRGVETTIHFIKSASGCLAKGGKMLVLASSNADISGLERTIMKMNVKMKIVKQKKLFYETLSVYELSWQ